MKFYRYEIVEYTTVGDDGDYHTSSFPNPNLNLYEYDLHKETPKGYWLNTGWFEGHHKWIPKESKRRYAYPTKQEALNNFIRRTNKRVKILTYQATSCRIGLSLAVVEQSKL